ncbi:Ankyrin repeat family protein [Striga hermonthica]|uniref:Ankyrin repeat family protein n=1 Tax=Striga hermonthica TaxID=68872 RepID=A0A9N7R8E0_STRHE|nr:Ankyrin repeat family protein [Striga hermonthica]
MDRAVHAAARGGNLGILVELLGDGGDVLAYRDSHGSTVLHTAAGRGHVEVVKHLTSSYDIINSVDNRGNTSLHVAAYYGRLPILEFLISSSPSLISVANVDGDTFLHSAIMGFRAPNFQRLDHHTNLMKKLLDGFVLKKLDDIINVQNKDGRTPLHTAIILDIPSEIVELILSVRYIDLNVRDCEGNTPLDLLFARTKTPSSEILIKRIVSAGGVFFSERKSRDSISLVSRPVLMGSPGISFKIPDAELVENDVEKNGYSKEIEVVISSPHSQSISTDLKKSSSMSGGKSRLGNFLRWLGKKEKSSSGSDFGGEDDTLSFKSYTMGSSSRDSPVSLRQQFFRPNSSSLASNKRIMSLESNGSGPSGNRKKLGAHDVRQVLPKSNLGSPCSAFSESSWTSPLSVSQCSNQSPSLDKMKMKRRLGSFNLRSMNNYFCLGNRSLAIEKSIKSQSQPLPEPEPEPYGLEDQEKSVLL